MSDSATYADWSKPCDSCGSTIERFKGMSLVTCGNCDTEYNAGGQRLVSNWRGNMSNYDDAVSDMAGYEAQYAGDE